MRCEAEVRRMLSQALRVPPQLIEAEASAQWRLRQQQTAVVQRAARAGARSVHALLRAETAAPLEGGKTGTTTIFFELWPRYLL